MPNNTQHWEKIYTQKNFDAVSWYAPHLHQSLALIESLCSDRTCSIIDIGGGESTLVDDLLSKGFHQLSVLDLSRAAIEFTQHRLGKKADAFQWYIGDITTIELPEHYFDLWHDRAVFHFLTQESERIAYIEQVKKSMKPGGYVIVATFGPEGPLQCSGLNVIRYSAKELHHQFGDDFQLMGSNILDHTTPFHTTQQFVYCWCKLA